MDKDATHLVSEALAKLNRLVDDEEVVIFNREEATALREVATFWLRVKAAAALGGSIGSGLKWMVIFGAAWSAFRAGLFDWLKSGMD